MPLIVSTSVREITRWFGGCSGGRRSLNGWSANGYYWAVRPDGRLGQKRRTRRRGPERKRDDYGYRDGTSRRRAGDDRSEGGRPGTGAAHRRGGYHAPH